MTTWGYLCTLCNQDVRQPCCHMRIEINAPSFACVCRVNGIPTRSYTGLTTYGRSPLQSAIEAETAERERPSEPVWQYGRNMGRPSIRRLPATPVEREYMVQCAVYIAAVLIMAAIVAWLLG